MVARKGRPPGISIDTEAVRAARLRRCLTQLDLAARTGLSARTISAVESGGLVARSTALAIASALELELERLIAEDA